MSQKSLIFRAVILGAVVLAAAGIILPLGWIITHNSMGLIASAAAGGICLLAGWVALVACEPLHRPQYALALVLVGVTTRMGIPLAGAVVVQFLGRPLADAGFLYYLIVFYPITLAAGTVLALPQRRAEGSDYAT
jgi:hypothetical protein